MTHPAENDADTIPPIGPLTLDQIDRITLAASAPLPDEDAVPAHLTPEVELRLERLADSENEAEMRWLVGEWLTEIEREVDRVIPPVKSDQEIR